MALKWRPAVWASVLFLSNVGSIAGLAVAAGFRHTRLVWAVTFLVIVVNYLVHRKLRPYRRSASGTVMALSGVLFVAGVTMAVGWSAANWPNHLGYLGLIATFFGAGQTLVTIRYVEWWTRKAGVVAVGCAALFFFGLVVVTVEGAAWGFGLMAAAVFLTPVALGLLSEWLLPAEAGMPGQTKTDRLPTGPTMFLVGAILLMLGVSVFVVEGVPARFVLGTATGLLVLVWAITSNFVLDVIGVAVAVALTWSGAPRGVAEHESVRPAEREEVIVALGDSFMSGEGAQRFFTGTNKRNEPGRNECRRAPTAYAVHAVEASDDAKYPDKVVFLACSGAKADDIHREAQYKGEPIGGPNNGLNQLANWDRAAARFRLTPKAVIASIGGNDALFGDIGQACVVPGKCPELGGFWLANLGLTERKVEDAYSAIAKAFPGVPVAVVPYPLPLRDTSCEWSVLSDSEHQFLHGYTHQLNEVLRAAANRHGFHFLAEMERAFAPPWDLRLCDQGDPEKVGVNFFAAHPVEGVLLEKLNPRNWFHNSLHPNHRGHGRMSQVLVEWLEDLANHKPLEPRAGRHEVATVEAIMNDPGFVHCAEPEAGPPSCRSKTGQWVTPNWRAPSGTGCGRYCYSSPGRRPSPCRLSGGGADAGPGRRRRNRVSAGLAEDTAAGGVVALDGGRPYDPSGTTPCLSLVATSRAPVARDGPAKRQTRGGSCPSRASLRRSIANACTRPVGG